MPTPLRNLLTPRFSLRALLVVVTVGCVVIGWRANRYLENCRDLNRLKGHFEKVVVLLGQDGQATVEALPIFADAYVTGIQIDFQKDVAESEGNIWSDLSGFKSLRNLDITFIYPPERPRHVNQMCATSITDASFKFCSFTDDSLLLALEMMPQLKSLQIIGGGGTLSRGFEGLGRCRELQALTLVEVNISPDTIHRLASKQLHRLVLRGRGIELSRNDAQAITEMRNLEELTLECDRVLSVLTLRELKQCKTLKSLTVDVGTMSEEECTAEALELEKALPNCKVKLLRYDAQL